MARADYKARLADSRRDPRSGIIGYERVLEITDGILSAARTVYAEGMRPLLVGALFAFTISMGEFGATVFLYRPETPTMPVAIFRFLGRPGALNYGQALAMSVLLMLVFVVAFLAIDHFRLGGEGEF